MALSRNNCSDLSLERRASFAILSNVVLPHTLHAVAGFMWIREKQDLLKHTWGRYARWPCSTFIIRYWKKKTIYIYI